VGRAHGRLLTCAALTALSSPILFHPIMDRRCFHCREGWSHPDMPLFGAFQSVLISGAWTGVPFFAAEGPASSIESDVQEQFVISVVRLLLVLICPGVVWLLWNSTILTERKRNAAIIAGMVRLLFSLCADLALVHAGVFRYSLDTMI